MKKDDVFTFTSKELDIMKLCATDYEKYEKQIEAIHAEGAHLSKRKDGMFQARSNLAKSLNQKLQYALNEHEKYRFIISNMMTMPSERRDHYKNLVVSFYSSFSALLLFFVCFFLLVNFPIGWVSDYTELFSRFGFPVLFGFDDFWSISSISGVASFISLYVLKFLFGFFVKYRLIDDFSEIDFSKLEFSEKYAAHSGIGKV